MNNIEHDKITVLFDDFVYMCCKNNKLVSYNSKSCEVLKQLDNDLLSNCTWERHCKDVSDSDLAYIHYITEDKCRQGTNPLYMYFYLYTPKEKSNKVLSFLKNIDGVKTAYIEQEVQISDVSQVPDLLSWQDHLQEDLGLNVLDAWEYSKGEGVKIGIIEFGFNKNHIDLQNVNISVDFPSSYPTTSQENHGTASLGVVGAENNGYGVTGIAYESDIYFSSIVWGVANAIMSLVNNDGFGEGDVMSLSIGYNNNGAVESSLAVYNVIAQVVALGITVCLAAGNNNINIDNLSGFSNHYPYLPENDSGSIIVGAGARNRSKLWFSNWGNRVSIQGRGDNVVTTGYGNILYAGMINKNYYYTATYNGTSSACPTVAGVVALVQSYRKQLGLPCYTSNEIRQIFINYGDEQTGDLIYNIGTRPNALNTIKNIRPAIVSNKLKFIPTMRSVIKEGMLYNGNPVDFDNDGLIVKSAEDVKGLLKVVNDYKKTDDTANVIFEYIIDELDDFNINAGTKYYIDKDTYKLTTDNDNNENEFIGYGLPNNKLFIIPIWERVG